MKELTSLNLKKKSGGKPEGSKNKIAIRFPLPIATFIFTMICLIFAFMFNDISPFGNQSILVSDLQAQYAPYLIAFKQHLSDINFDHFIESLSYSFGLGAGKNFFATFGYYMASPVNWIAFLFPVEKVYDAVSVIMIIKLSFAAAFMTLFLQKRSSNPKAKMLILFGLMYAFTSYSLVFMFNIMWLDGYALLPLILYFIESFLEKGKKSGLVISLVVLFFANYYIAYMVGVSCFLYLMSRIFKDHVVTGKKEITGKIVKFIVLAVLSAFAIGAMLIPTGLDTLVNADVTKSIASSDPVNHSLADIVDQLFLGYVGGFDSLGSNLPFVFSSLFNLVLITFFFVSNAFDKKEKRIYGGMFCAIYLFFDIAVLDIAWQAFDTPNWFSHRYSFVFYPLYFIIALKAYEKLSEITTKEMYKAYGILIAILLFAQSFGDMRKDGNIFISNLVLITIYVLLFAATKVTNWHKQLKDMPKLIGFFMVLIVVFEVAFYGSRLSSVSTLLTQNDKTEYSDEALALMELSEGSKNAEIYTGERIDYEYTQNTLEDDDSLVIGSSDAMLLCGNRGISFFNSSSNKRFGRFLKQLGYDVNYNYFYDVFSYCSMPTNAFFSIGAAITSREYTDADVSVQAPDNSNFFVNLNSQVLPSAFEVDRSAMDFDFYSLEKSNSDSKNYFNFQDEWLSSMFSSEFNRNVFQEIPYDVEYQNATEIDFDKYGLENSVIETGEDTLGVEDTESLTEFSTLVRQNNDLPGIVTYSFRATSTNEIYMNISVPRIIGNCQVSVNGSVIASYSGGSDFSQIVRVGAFSKGEKVSVSLSFFDSTFDYASVNFAELESDFFSEEFAQINQDAVKTIEFSNGYASYETVLDEDHIMLTTIPYEDGWTAYVDGKRAQIVKYQDALIAIDCGTGRHTVVLKYEAPGLKAGLALTGVGIVGLIAIAVIDANKQRKVKKS